MIGAVDRTVAGQLEALETAIARRADLPDEARADLAERVAALRASVERQGEAAGEARHQLAHDLRAHLNAIAGWVHILRLERATPATIGRATEVFDRSVRTLIGLIEAYTARDR